MAKGGMTRQDCNSFANIETPQRYHLSHGNGRIYRAAHQQQHADARWFWHARRHYRQENDLWLTLVDSRFDPFAADEEATLTATLLCTNGECASSLMAGTPLAFDFPGPIAQVCLLGTPTDPGQSVRQRNARWKLVSSLVLNHVSLTEGDEALASLKEMLSLYASSGESVAVWQQIDGIRAMRCERASEHSGRDAWRGWRNGIRVTLTLDPQAFTASSRLLFAAIIARFLAHNATANCFVHTVLQDDSEEIPLWRDTDPTRPIV
ncbi:TPA: type VI secretion system baseplate subunit TssF [Citrobacter freundii]|nr:type VI secretion system baseplate subunit TssF [Citrobacter freundii]HAT2484897.1 type VI secretion system baseplate subunit TssF [Citrobacter freundii]HAT2718713.1 type VI secretion system baseplate subunit TssF [Citrobacter freundii]HAT2729052.1 type VI secretion system baseplate subunit TssF [Citrobacter freundii]HBC0512521.1 type VI secretion system baseplate subunit TssF [Citrobacter freundii]